MRQNLPVNSRPLGLALLALLVSGTLAACGGSGTSTQTTTSAAATNAAIKSAYVKFFSSKTPTSTRVLLLQNGKQFESAISALAQNPLAANTSATVSSVTLQGPNKAKVVYTVNLSGAAIPGLKNRTGSAVRESGTWKVGAESFCALVSLGGSPPKACKNLGG
jgi:ABC-type glycerol-3-phosphate transport system substrate-binding protein